MTDNLKDKTLLELQTELNAVNENIIVETKQDTDTEFLCAVCGEMLVAPCVTVTQAMNCMYFDGENV